MSIQVGNQLQSFTKDFTARQDATLSQGIASITSSAQVASQAIQAATMVTTVIACIALLAMMAMIAIAIFLNVNTKKQVSARWWVHEHLHHKVEQTWAEVEQTWAMQAPTVRNIGNALVKWHHRQALRVKSGQLLAWRGGQLAWRGGQIALVKRPLATESQVWSCGRGNMAGRGGLLQWYTCLPRLLTLYVNLSTTRDTTSRHSIRLARSQTDCSNCTWCKFKMHPPTLFFFWVQEDK